jgi:hypothetical protein
MIDCVSRTPLGEREQMTKTCTYHEALMIALQLPKAEIHCHLDGSLLPSFLFERAELRGCRSDLPKTAGGLRTMVDEMKGEMRKGANAGHSGLKPGQNWPIFDLMNRFLQTAEELETAALCVARHVRDVHRVCLLELRFCPALHTLEGLSEREAVEAVGRGLKQAEADNDVRPMMKDDNSGDDDYSRIWRQQQQQQQRLRFRGGVILCALRSKPSPHALHTAQLCLDMLAPHLKQRQARRRTRIEKAATHAAPGVLGAPGATSSSAEDTCSLASSDLIDGGCVIGFDVAGSEQFPLSLPAISEALSYCTANGVPITVHAGEVGSLCIFDLCVCAFALDFMLAHLSNQPLFSLTSCTPNDAAWPPPGSHRLHP